MTSRFRYTIITFALIGIFILAQLVYSTRVNDETKIAAVVQKVSEGGLKDIVVELRGVRGVHYISKSNTKGLNSDELGNSLTGKEISLTYIKPGIFSRFSPATDTRLISRIELGDSIIYSRSN